MRSFNHCLTTSKSGKSVIFKITVDDRFGEETINFSSVTGWRARLATKHLSFDTEEWNDDVVRKFVGLSVLKSSKDKFEAMQFMEQVKTLGNMEVHFWANKFLTNENSAKAWRALYK